MISFTQLRLENIVEYIKEAEGFFPVKYVCSAGVLSIGYGTALTRGLYPYEKEKLGINSIKELHEIDKETAEYLLKNELYEIITKLEQIEWIYELDVRIMPVVLDMCYNLGVNGWLKFVKAIEALRNKNYPEAMIEILDSKYLSDVGGRAITNALRIANVNLSLQDGRRLKKILERRIKK